MVLVITILALTPAKELIFIIENEKLTQQEERIVELEKKIQFLSKELEEMASANKRLKYAIFLGTTDSLDSNSTIYDSLRIDEKSKKPVEGNIFSSIFYFFQNLFTATAQSVSFISPTDGFIINKFSPEEGHLGIDFSVKEGTPVFAAESGLIIFSDFTPEDGKKIIIQHEENFISVYKHCSVLIKKEREYVSKGELIALSGNSGLRTTGAHLHFEIWLDGKPVDPEQFLMNQ